MGADGDVTWQKALEVNLDPRIYGVLAEIGAGQEVARWFFRVGGAAGTIAKTMSAYDMTVSDQIYGKAGRYVSRERLVAMLDHEYGLLVERLGESRGAEACFFAFADTVAARNYQGTNTCRGWVGLRFQVEPGSPPSDALLHVVPLDETNAEQQEAIGTLGVNLIHAAYKLRDGGLEPFLRALLDGLSIERLVVDAVHLSGPAFPPADPVDLGLALLRAEVARAILLEPGGVLTPPVDVVRKRPIVIERGRFASQTDAYARLLSAGLAQLRQELPDAERQPIGLFELSVNSIREAPGPAALKARIQALLPQGYPVLVSRLRESFLLTHYLRRMSREALRFVAGASSIVELLDDRHYGHLPGGLLEGVGKLLADNVRVYVHPMEVEAFRSHLTSFGFDLATLSFPGGGAVTAQNLMLHGPLGYLYGHLLARGWIVPIPGTPTGPARAATPGPTLADG
jgi:hypothetical protein